MQAHLARAMLCAVALLTTSRVAEGQGLLVQSTSGEIAADFDGRNLDYASGISNGYGRFREWLLFRLGGAVKDPQLLKFDFTLRPLIGQQYWTGLSSSPNGTITSLNGVGKIELLRARTISLSANALVLDENQSLRFGAEQRVDVASWGARLEARWQPLPLRLEYRDRSLDRVLRSSPGAVSRVDNRYRRLRLTAQNKKTRLLLERADFDDRQNGADFVQLLGTLNHAYRWGKGSRLTSYFQYLNRSGSGVTESFAWRQRVQILHTRTVSSEAGYNLFDRTVPDDFSRGWGGDYVARWQATRNLRPSLEGYTQSQRFRVGKQSYSRVRPRLEVVTGSPTGIRFRASAGTGYEWHRQTTSETGGFGTVLDERHVVDESQRFLLNEPFPEPSTVVIRSEDASVIFEPDFDYRLIQTGIFLEVVALPGGRLEPGTTVSVDYRFSLLPGGEADAWIYDYDLSVSLGPATAYHRRAEQQELGDGEPTLIPTLIEYDNITTGLRVHGPTPLGALSFWAEHQRRKSRLYRFESLGVGGNWSFLVTSRVRGIVSASWSTRTNGTRFDLLKGESSVEWAPWRNLRIIGRLSMYDWEEPGFRNERFVGGGVGADWQLRQLRLSFRYDRNSWSQSSARTEDRLVARISREF